MTVIVAEIGINHNGDLAIAQQLIDMAVACGCDAVKFQKRTIDIVYSAEEQAKPRESPWGTTNGEQKRGLEFGRDEFDAIDAYCRSKGIRWFASAWDIPSLEFLSQYDCPYNKLASPMLTNVEFVGAVLADAKETLISTGMDKLYTVRKVASMFHVEQVPFVLMHCVSTYPCPDNELNLRRIEALRQIHPRIGYSGHEVGPMPTVIAVALGAEVVERHITLDRSMYGSDQAASLEKRGLEIMCKEIRAMDDYLGKGLDVIANGVEANAYKLRYWV